MSTRLLAIFLPWRLFLAGLPLLLATGCPATDARFAAQLHLAPPVEVGDALLFVDSGRMRVTRLRDGGSGIAQDALALPFVPATQALAPDHSRLFLLDGVLEKGHQSLAWLGASGEPTRLHLNTYYSGLAVSADSQTLLAYHAPGKAAAGVVIAGELALIDVHTEPPKLQSATIGGMATAPLAAYLTPPVQLADGAHRVAWVETTSALGIADFGPQAARTLVVPLATAGAAAGIVPKRTLARVDAGSVHLYLIASGSNDAVHVSLDLTTDPPAVSLDQIASGPAPDDLALVDTAAGLRVLTVHAGAAQLALLNPTTGTGTAVTLQAQARHIELYGGADGKGHALLWADGVSHVQRVALEDVDKKKGKAVTDVALGGGVKSVSRVGSQFLIQAVSGELSAYDADHDRLTVLSGVGDVRSVRVLGNAVWVVGAVPGGNRLARIDLGNLSAQSLELTLPVAGISPWGSSGTALWASGDGSGVLLALPGGALDLDTAWLSQGFALEGASEAP